MRAGNAIFERSQFLAKIDNGMKLDGFKYLPVVVAPRNVWDLPPHANRCNAHSTNRKRLYSASSQAQTNLSFHRLRPIVVECRPVLVSLLIPISLLAEWSLLKVDSCMADSYRRYDRVVSERPPSLPLFHPT